MLQAKAVDKLNGMASGSSNTTSLKRDFNDDSTTDFTMRPNFVNKQKLRRMFSCALCGDIPLQPYQTSCGNRVCKNCIEAEFGDRTVIPCHFSHSDVEEDVLWAEPCQMQGLTRNDLTPDVAAQRSLRSAKCRCQHQSYGCRETPSWRDLTDHQQSCEFLPKACPIKTCGAILVAKDFNSHVLDCDCALTRCLFCNNSFQRKYMQKHKDRCDHADTQCGSCMTKFRVPRQLNVHLQTNAPCLRTAGRCYYFNSCKFESNDLAALKQHLSCSVNQHLEYLTVQMKDIEDAAENKENSFIADVRKAIRSKVNPLELFFSEVTGNFNKLKTDISIRELTGEYVVEAMKTVDRDSKNINSVHNTLTSMESSMKETYSSGHQWLQQNVPHLTKQTRDIKDFLKIGTDLELTAYDGKYIWTIDNYQHWKRQNSVRYSPAFFTSRYGYKLCIGAITSEEHIDLMIVLMKSDYDDLLQFPFNQSVSISILAPHKPELSRQRTIKGDPHLNTFDKPQSDMNSPFKITMFERLSVVESHDFLIADTLYVRVKVEPGGDVIP